MENDLRLIRASFAYGNQPVLRSLDLEMVSGVNGVLGPNGAGKSTMLRVLAGILRLDAGAMSWAGAEVVTRRELSTFRESVGYLPQTPGWHQEASTRELVSYFAVSRMGRSPSTRAAVDSAIEMVGLSDIRDTRLGRLSGGQFRRAFLAQAIVHDPGILILDEPTAGLDPVQRVRLREYVLAISENRTVIWATHIVDDLINLADNVFVLADGSVRWEGPPGELTELGARSSDEARGMSAGERGFLEVLSRPSVARGRDNDNGGHA